MRLSRPVLGVAIVSVLVAMALALPSTTFASTSVAKGTTRGLADAEPQRSASVDLLALSPDDDIPGVDLPLSAEGTAVVDGTLSDADDSDDVFAVLLMAGEQIDLSLSGADGTDFGLYLFGPYATTVYGLEPMVGVDPHYDMPGGYPLTISYVVPMTGIYYVDVWTWYNDETLKSGGSGAYTLNAAFIRQDTEVQLSTTPRNLPYGGTATISGVINGRFSVPSGNVFLHGSLNGLSFLPLFGQSYTGGQFTFMVGPVYQKEYYQVIFEGNQGFNTSTAGLYFGCYASLSTPSCSSTVYHGRSFTVTGFLKPRHTSGSYPVKLYCYRYEGGAWRYRKSVSAKASYYNSTTSKCTAAVNLPYAGKWRIRAYHADAGHVATWSSYRYVTAK